MPLILTIRDWRKQLGFGIPGLLNPTGATAVVTSVFFLNFSLGSRHFEAESRPCSGTRLTPLDHVSICRLFYLCL